MNLGFPEMLFIFILALLIFGPKKLPEIGKQIGKAMHEFRKASNQFRAQLEVEVHDLERSGEAKQAETPVPAPPEGTVPAATPMAEAASATASEAKAPDA